MEPTSLPTTERRLRWFHPTPARLLIVLLMVEGSLLLSKPWLPKGYAVLIAIAAVGVTLVLTLIWFVLALVCHWRFQFTLRSLLVATVAVAIPFSWLGAEMKRAREQAVEVSSFKKVGGYAIYDYEAQDGGIPTLGAEAPGPEWLRKLVGDDFFTNVTSMSFNGDYVTVTDAGLEHLEGLTQQHRLAVESTPVTNDGLKHLKDLTQLQWLYLDGTKVTDDGMEYLKGLTQLQQLCLNRAQGTDAGLVQIQELRQLQWLGLTGTKVTDEGIKKLQQVLPNCKIEREKWKP